MKVSKLCLHFRCEISVYLQTFSARAFCAHTCTDEYKCICHPFPAALWSVRLSVTLFKQYYIILDNLKPFLVRSSRIKSNVLSPHSEKEKSATTARCDFWSHGHHYYFYVPRLAFLALCSSPRWKKIIPTKHWVQLLLQCCFGATASTTTKIAINSTNF